MSPKHSRAGGFTLIEVLTAVAIVSILAAIAYPTYVNYVFRAKAVEALEALSGYQIRMEQRFQDVGNYGGANCAIPVPNGLRNFTVSCEIGNSVTEFEASAVGNGPMAGVEYRINQSRQRWTPSHPKGEKNDCWTIRGGTCDT